MANDEKGTPLSDVFGPPDGTPDSWAEALAAEREHAAALVRELRHIATNCDHSPSRGVGEHIHEPTTGGSVYCGPCRAWRVLNGSPEAAHFAREEPTDVAADRGEIGQVRLQGWFDSGARLWTVRVLVNGVQAGILTMNDGQYEVLTAALSACGQPWILASALEDLQ